ncbi:asparaginase [Roseateles sp. SL47]|uniref:asparaginase n=1 Tax=Roseateles sp. SL47 TaxID=2995138 RepID=UPI002271221C|nr:asparaginase [Roseateles sp. SL47]WAC74601.1 asparaginase [Roseateles sp. SL47]
MRPTVPLFATGGTIAMKLDPRTHAPVPALTGEALVAAVPGLNELAQLEVHEVANVPSDYMDPPRWLALHAAISRALARDEVAGAVVSHGTDTLEETAWFLDLTLASTKPVVMVGAQRNASEPDFDGPRNLRHAVRICLCPQAHHKGVLVALNGQINAAREVSKTHTSDVGAFQSGPFGLLGVVEEDRVQWARSPLRRQHVALTGQPLPRVDIVPMYAGADGALLRAALAAGARGVVVQALGYGNVNPELHEAVREALTRGVVVVIASRCPQGRTLPLYGFVGGGRTLQGAGAVFSDDLSPQKTRILLMLALQAGHGPDIIQELFLR